MTTSRWRRHPSCLAPQRTHPLPKRLGRAVLAGLGLAFGAGPALADECADWMARLASAQGRVEAQPARRPNWLPALLEQPFCPGDKVRTLLQSRASLRLPNQTFFSLDQSSTVVFSNVKAEEPSLIELLQGALFSRSRTPRLLDIKTPFVNATIKGTEFLVAVGPDETRVTVFEGEVEVSNEHGRASLTNGQTAVAARGQAPRLVLDIKPEDAVHWALYYPPLVDFQDLAGRGPEFAAAVERYAAGDAAGALAALDRVPETARDAGYAALKASVLLSVGRLDEAEPLLAAPAGKAPAAIQALRSVVALARNRKDEALALADAAVAADGGAAAARMAQSYARQARFDLAGALEAADRAGELRPEDALVQARRAELLASLERWREAREAAERAARLDPHQPRARVILGFSELRDGDTGAALASFRRAQALDSAEPLARFGAGLALIRDGELREGTAALEEAASLDPGNSLIRSYLGKAYYEQRRGQVAGVQFDQARALDPRDPTPWFYDAIRKQTENRPVEALRDLQTSMALNDNRAVYRSKLALDEDLAARGAALGRIYQELGFQPRGLVEGWKSLAEDPADYTAHRLLSDTYSALPGHNIARVSELLQSQLLQPLNITPVQPRLAESQLFLLGNLGPADASLNEFNPLFNRNRFSLLASGLVGSNDTYADEVVHSGLWDDFSYSLGQSHYETKGFRANNDIDVNLYNAYVQGRVTPWLNVQGEYRHRDVEAGSLNSYFDTSNPFLQYNLRNNRQEGNTDSYRFGVHVAPTARSDVLGSFIHVDQEGTFWTDRVTPPNLSILEGNSGEIQYIQRHEVITMILGGGYYRLDGTYSFLDLRSSQKQEHGEGYAYAYFNYPESVHLTLGVSADYLKITDDSSFSKLEDTTQTINPKFGLLWNLTPDTVLRAAGFRTIRPSLLTDQTLEPTQIAGFNQFYDDFIGTDAVRWGVGIDHRFDQDFTGGVEVSRRYLDVPTLGLHGREFKESQYRAYLQWTPHPRWAGSLEYLRENFANLDTGGALDTETQIIPLGISYFDPSGIFTKFRASYYDQTVGLAAGSDSDEAVFLDLSLGYRLPKRYGIAELQFQNLLDQNYRYQGMQDRRPPPIDGIPSSQQPFPPEFTIFARLTLAL
jgi:tetratricopeptide (TPR) repeat protein